MAATIRFNLFLRYKWMKESHNMPLGSSSISHHQKKPYFKGKPVPPRVLSCRVHSPAGGKCKRIGLNDASLNAPPRRYTLRYPLFLDWKILNGRYCSTASIVNNTVEPIEIEELIFLSIISSKGSGRKNGLHHSVTGEESCIGGKFCNDKRLLNQFCRIPEIIGVSGSHIAGR